MKKILISIIVFTILGFCQNTFALIKTSNLILASRFEGNTLDWTGNGHIGTVTGCTTGIGNAGYGYTFDGIDDDINFGNIPQLSGGTATYTVIVSTTLTEPIATRVLFVYDQNSFLNTDDIYLYWNGVTVRYQTGGAGESSADITDLSDGKWHRIALVKTSTNALIYEDGRLKENVVREGAPFGGAWQFYLGFKANASSWQGNQDELLIYDRALTEAEIRQDYSGFSPGE